MRDAWFAIPGDLATATGGYAYARRLMAAMPAAGWQLWHVRLPPGFPLPSLEELDVASRALKDIPQGSPILVDGLAYGALPRRLLDGLGGRWVALVHHPLALESGLSREAAGQLRSSERAALAAAVAVIATSPRTAATLAADYGVPEERLHVAVPGTDPAARARGNGATPCLLCVATVTARKGHDVLVGALATLADLPWTVRMIGSLDRDSAAVADLRAAIRKSGLEERIALEGEVSSETLERAYGQADAFVLASRHEGYGMAFAEALAHGLPVIGCAAGAVPATVPAGAGILVTPDDAGALATALRRVLTDSALRERLAEAAWRHGHNLPGWGDTARAVARALESAAA